MLFSCDLRALKPSPEAFHAALARLGQPAERVLFIDDTEANAAAARTLGMDAIHFTGADALRAALVERGLIG
jgi:HAD superfamily hydrolase (TIGR01509 family)